MCYMHDMSHFCNATFVLSFVWVLIVGHVIHNVIVTALGWSVVNSRFE